MEDVVIEDIELFDRPTGEKTVTPEGEAYFENQQYRAAVLLRETLVEVLGLLATGG